MLKRFASYYRPHMKLFIADLVCAFLLSACDLFYPAMTRRMLNDSIPNGDLKGLLIIAAALLVLYLIKTGLNYFVLYYGHVMGVRMQADMRRDVFDHMQKLPLTYFDNNKTGTIMSRIINDLMDVSELAHHGPEDLFVSFVMLVGSFAVMASICWQLTLIIFIGIPVMVWLAVRKRRSMHDAFIVTRAEVGEINSSLENSISGIRVSKAYTNVEEESRGFAEGNSRFITARSRAYKVMGEFHATNGLIGDLLMLMMYLAGGLFCFYEIITVADFVAFTLYITLFMTPIKRLVSFVEQYQNGMTGFTRFCEIMDYPEETDSPDAEDIGRVKGEIEFRNVTFSYEDGRNVIEDMSFSLPAGKTLALVGPSGGGKTTVCHIIPRFYNISSGSVLIDGKDISEVTLQSLRRNVGIVAQDVFLFNSTIYDNIAYGTPGATREQVVEAAKRADIHDYITGLPNGYETLVGERGVRLSGGQKQRVAIARAFLKNPPVLILDEATSALDNASEAMIQRSLEELSRGRTTIVVAHRLTTVRKADEILVITDEGIAERGKHGELIEAGGVYSELWKNYITVDGAEEK